MRASLFHKLGKKEGPGSEIFVHIYLIRNYFFKGEKNNEKPGKC